MYKMSKVAADYLDDRGNCSQRILFGFNGFKMRFLAFRHWKRFSLWIKKT